jgi:SAM-dependent methyltransferase
MAGKFTDDTYGERVADVYDAWYPDYDEAAIDRLAKLSHRGKALELGIGTGRIAIPLHQRGIEVYGVDASPAMVAKLHQKPGGEEISVTMGSFAELPVTGSYSLIYVLFNTFYALLTQEEQVRCFESVAQHLETDGVFVLEVFVPDLTRYRDRQAISAIGVDEDQLRIDATRIDPATQTLISQHIILSEQGVRLYPVRLRYAYPAEMDLMARLAGLRLLERWENWKGDPFSADSTKHVSVYGKA